jgi:ribonucleoside-triphosphate reductase
MERAKNSLEIKRKVLENLTSNNLYPYTKYYLRDIKKRFDQYWKNHFSTIGLIGVNEACLNLIGENVGTEMGQKFAVKIMDFMREKLIDFQEETGNNYNLEATPAEGTTYRLARLDKAKYPEIIVANEQEYQKGAEPFYTNSTQLPVNFSEDIFETLELQDDIQTKYTGGTVLHLYAGERVQNTDSIKNLVNKVCNNFKLPYFTFSPTFSICKEHGYLNGEHEKCPYCGKSCEVYSRVVGYLRPVQQWNDGKKAEFKMRKNFKVVD